MMSALDVGTLPQWLLVTLAVLAVGRYWILGMPAGLELEETEGEMHNRPVTL